MNDSGALLVLAVAVAVAALWCFLCAFLIHVHRRWRQARVNRDRWMRLLK